VRRLLIASIFSLLVGITIFFWSGSEDDSTSIDALSLSFALNEGGNTTLGDLVSETGRPLVVNFWATWCAPCLEELPMFESSNQKFGDEVNFLGINVSDSPTKAEKMIDDIGISYLMGRDPEGNFLVELGVMGLPATAFIDSQGNLIDVHIGQISITDLDMKISWIR
tara:strand:- start:1859 stop:2359 length:501 start_codon:yes stop_codon:yes gene_type:complete